MNLQDKYAEWKGTALEQITDEWRKDNITGRVERLFPDMPRELAQNVAGFAMDKGDLSDRHLRFAGQFVCPHSKKTYDFRGGSVRYYCKHCGFTWS